MYIGQKKKTINRFFISVILIAAGSLLIAAGFFLKKYLPNEVFWPFAPFRFLNSQISRLGNAFLRPVYLLNENNQLREMNSFLQSENAKMEVLQKENEFLASQLGLAKKRGQTLVEARIIGQEITSLFSIATINAGFNQGVKEKSAVVSGGSFLAGRIIKTEPEKSRVLLVSDPASKVAAATLSSAKGVVYGKSSNELVFDLIPLGSQLKSGDMVFTSGIDGIYPPDLPIGRIKSIISRESDSYQKALVEPIVDFRDIERVLVVIY